MPAEEALIRKLDPQEVANHLLAHPGIVNNSFAIYDPREKGRRGLVGEILHLAGTPDQLLQALDWGDNHATNYSLMAHVLGIPRWQASMVAFTGNHDNTPRLDRAAQALTEPETLIGERAPFVFSFWNLIEGYDQKNWQRIYHRIGPVGSDFMSLFNPNPELSEALNESSDGSSDFDLVKHDPGFAAIVANDQALGDAGFGGPKSLVFNTAWRFTESSYMLGIDIPFKWFRGKRPPDSKERPGDSDLADAIGHVGSLASCEVVGAKIISEHGGTFAYLPYFEDPEDNPLTIDWIHDHPYILTPTR